jgi:hypothetical protein
MHGTIFKIPSFLLFLMPFVNAYTSQSGVNNYEDFASFFWNTIMIFLTIFSFFWYLIPITLGFLYLMHLIGFDKYMDLWST